LRRTVKREFAPEAKAAGLPFEPGGTFELDANLKKVDHRWLIVGL